MGDRHVLCYKRRMTSPKPVVRAVALAAALLSLPSPAREASAQTSAHTGLLVAPDGRCLDLVGNYTATKPPPDGTRVTLDRCDGTPSQRWTATFGDDNDIRSFGGLMLYARASPAPGAPAAVTLYVASAARDGQMARFDRGRVFIIGGDCLTQPAPNTNLLVAAHCEDYPTQRWQVR